MEAILRSVLLRQEQMEMQWDAEFEQQKQLFHINTSTLIDMLPIQPRKKRLKLDGRMQAVIPSHDKENLYGVQGIPASNGISLKLPKMKAPHSRGLAKRDLNTRFCDNDVKNVGRVVAKPADSQPSLRMCSEADTMQQNASIVQAVTSMYEESTAVSGKFEANEDHVSPPIDESPVGDNRKRLRSGQEGDIILQDCNEQNLVPSTHAVVDVSEKRSKSKRTRRLGKASEEARELSHVVRCNEPENVSKVEVEETCTGAQVTKSEIESKVMEPEIVRKGPARRGRPNGLTTVANTAALPEKVIKEPVRRGRAKQTAVPPVAQRVTRSRARIVDSAIVSEPERVTRSRVIESMVESKPDLSSTQVVGKEPAQQDVKMGEGEHRGRPPNQIVEGEMEACGKPDVCAPPSEILLDEPSSKRSQSYGQKSVTRKSSQDISVADGLVKRGLPHIDSQEEAVSSHVKFAEYRERITPPVAAILTQLQDSHVDHLKNSQHDGQPLTQLDATEKDLGFREVAFALAEHPLDGLCKDTELQDGNAVVDSTSANENAKNTHCLVDSKGDTLVEKDPNEGGSPVQLERTREEMQACVSESPRPSAVRLSLCRVASRHFGEDSVLISNVTSIGEISRTALPNIKEANTTLLSEVIEGSLPPSKNPGVVGNLIVPRLQNSSPPSGRTLSVPSPLELSEARNDASASEVHVLPTSCMTRKPIVSDFSLAAGGGAGDNPLADLVMLPSGRQGSENRNVIDCPNSIETTGGSSRETARVSMQCVSPVNPPINFGNSEEEASRMDTTREQVKSDAVSPVGYSEARAIEEAMRCSLEQEFHPDVTLTLNRWQFRKRLSPRSKARARRWRSDVAANNVDYGRGKSSDAAAASPSRVVSSRDRSLEGAAYEPFLEAQSPEVPLPGVEASISSGAERSVSSLCDKILSRDLKDREIEDNTVEYEIVQTADEIGNPSPLPLLQSIYTLSQACQNDMVGARGFLEDGDQQQVHNLIESAKKIVEQLSSKVVGPPPRTPASNDPESNNSKFYGHTNLYPDRFRLFITPRTSPAALPIFSPSSSTLLSSAAPEVASPLPGDNEATSPPMKHLIRETAEHSDNVASPAPSRTPKNGKLTDARSMYQSGECENAFKCSPVLGSGSKIFTLVAPIEVHLASDVPSKRMVPEMSTISSPALLNVRALPSCDGSAQLSDGLLSAVGTVELVLQPSSEGPLDLEIVEETEKLSTRFYALSKDCVGISSSGKEIRNFLGDGPESLISHSTNPPSPVPNLRLSAGSVYHQLEGARLGVKNTTPSPRHVCLDAEDNENAAVVTEETGIPCSPIFMGNELERVALQHEGISAPTEEPVTCAQSVANAKLGVEPEGSSNLISDLRSIMPSTSNPPRSNLVTSLRSFIPLIQQQQIAAPYPNGKRDVKVKALEAAEAAKRLAEQKEIEKQERKKAAEVAKREKQERAAQERLAKRENAAQEKLKQHEARAVRENEEANKRKAGAAAPSNSTNSTNSQGVNNQSVLFKVKKTHELKLKMDQDKQERLVEEQRRKEEEWRKKEAENAARKRKHEAAEKKEREEKRRRQEEAMKAHREMEERQRFELEKKAQKQKALEGLEKERKAIEDELKRQKRLDKEREVEQRRKKEEEKEIAWLDMKEATRKRKEEIVKQMKLLEIEGRQQAGKIRRPSEDPAMPSTGPYHSFMASLHIAMGVGEGVGAYLSGVSSIVDPQRVSSQSLAGHPLRILQHSAEGSGAIRNSQAALRVPRTTPENVQAGVNSNAILRSGKPLFRTPPEALGNAASGGDSTAEVSRDRINIQVQTGPSVVVDGSRPCQPGQVGFAGPPGGLTGQLEKGLQSYIISPFRDSEDEDSEEEEKRSLKPIPQWARKENVFPQLVRQLEQDPDDIFVGANSCSLDEVFEVKGSKRRPDFKRRGSSGDWAKDCLTWQEQIQYKVTMGYLH